MKLFTTQWLTAVFPDYKGAAHKSIEVAEVSTDSRKKTNHSLFIPLVGENFDGHHYMKEAFNQGAVAALWQNKKELPAFLPADFPVFFVEDTLSALQDLAIAYREKVNPAVIGVTGSNGKTTTKDLIASIVGSSLKTHHTIGNLNNQIGVPITILSMPPDTEALVVEMGMNHFGEIETLSNIAKPDYAVITNIGESHIEYLGSREGIAKAKLEITKGMNKDGHLLIDGDEALLRQVHQRRHVITCGFDPGNDVYIKNVNLFTNRTQFELSDGEVYTIPLLGSHHALNAAFAVIIAKLLDVAKDKVKQGLAALKQTSMRFELLSGKNGSSIINDAYNASPTSMKASINVVKQLEGFRQKVLVLGDIFELGEQSKSLHQSVADSIDDSADAVFSLGDDAGDITSIVEKRYQTIDCRHFASKEELSAALEEYVSKDTLILFKASRGMQFESLVKQVIDPS
ncbi:UDP-N-acetylmuramoyl-tripeptide--D-alanyl-D-alanine ligase [Lentibacillus halodurans]|uniref:UDP-N-acetylmuramoyl-tripeptide--D-alanyl-D-alanine ligase n=1 Tax=Lentibacillus halodurans TaxID=237679 RepID=A0A1I0Z096_9BACI|nr:UDP-N-acetylmuramoyl-tripeptide--D-alanyl-D-alanine ligase [Lentibacillus halodurans]SFB18951.1 UDP-N-acetylmuramoyl-tripeptide--D-alanyl-D-alanine ligase [Lentibacillus halodurans]